LEILSVCREFKPCVLVVDEPVLAAINGAMERAVDVGSSIRVLMLLDRDDPVASQRCLRLGFSGVVMRDASAEVLRRALEAVAKGELWATRQSLAELVRDLLSKANPSKLTGRELQILKLVASGCSNQEVANCLFVTRDTIRWHLKSLYSKLGAMNREQAIGRALNAGILVLAKAAQPEAARHPRRKSVSSD
jgi:DNA-binding NarL/FixJ family response regulator